VIRGQVDAVSKRFQMLGFRGSTEEKRISKIFRFGYRKVVNDKKVPDPVGSAVLPQKTSNAQRPTSNAQFRGNVCLSALGVRRSMFSFPPLALDRNLTRTKQLVLFVPQAPRFLYYKRDSLGNLF
jgi:hypothetical protein